MPTPNFFKKKHATYKRIEETRSAFEAEVLENLRSRGIAYQYEPASGRLEYAVPRPTRLYLPDVILPNGIIVELKGYFLSEDRAKMLAVRESNPDADIRFVFQNWNSPVEGARVRKDGTKMSCREWCEINDFICSNKVIPDYWLLPTSPRTLKKGSKPKKK